ncbi:hypothetical protein Bca101_096786 [Brassica carinata]
MVKLIIDLMGLSLVRRCALPCRWVVGLRLRLLSVCTVPVSFSNGVCVCCWCVQYLLDLIWFLVRSGNTLLVQMWVLHCVGLVWQTLKQGISSFLALPSGRSTSSSVFGCLIGAIIHLCSLVLRYGWTDESISGPLPISLKFLRPVSILLLEIDALFILECNHHVYSLTFVSTFGLCLNSWSSFFLDI